MMISEQRTRAAEVATLYRGRPDVKRTKQPAKVAMLYRSEGQGPAVQFEGRDIQGGARFTRWYHNKKIIYSSGEFFT